MGCLILDNRLLTLSNFFPYMHVHFRDCVIFKHLLHFITEVVHRRNKVEY